MTKLEQISKLFTKELKQVDKNHCLTPIEVLQNILEDLQIDEWGALIQDLE